MRKVLFLEVVMFQLSPAFLNPRKLFLIPLIIIISLCAGAGARAQDPSPTPGAVSNVRVSNVTWNLVKVEWDDASPSSDYGYGAHFYVGGNRQHSYYRSSDWQPYIIAQNLYYVRPSTAYSKVVISKCRKAVNDCDDIEWVDGPGFTTTAAPAALPQSLNPSVSAITGTSASISWSAFAAHVATLGSIDSYWLYVRLTGHSIGAPYQFPAADDTTASLSGLKRGRAYTVRLSALINESGTYKAYEVSVGFDTLPPTATPTPPGFVPSPTPIPESEIVSDITSDSFTVKWNGRPGITYWVEIFEVLPCETCVLGYREHNKFFWHNIRGAKLHTYKFKRLKPDTVYGVDLLEHAYENFYKVIYGNNEIRTLPAAGQGSDSPPRRQAQASTGSFGKLRINDIDMNSATFLWDGPTSDGDVYLVTVEMDGELHVHNTANATELALSSLRPGKKYSVEVQRFRSVMTGQGQEYQSAGSLRGSFTTLLTAADTPTATAASTATATASPTNSPTSTNTASPTTAPTESPAQPPSQLPTDGSLGLAFSAVSKDHISVIWPDMGEDTLLYYLEISGGKLYDFAMIHDHETTAHTFGGLAADSAYTFLFTVINQDG
ncbi:MAG: fibronectin type III domain-containing protein, partial [Chloroflexi bacterium]|nr:fibronectin type III domain-containing protein [Chloroflexota bacterium]